LFTNWLGQAQTKSLVGNANTFFITEHNHLLLILPEITTIAMAILTVFLDRCENLVDMDIIGKVRCRTMDGGA
jgi:hypothetical protein